MWWCSLAFLVPLSVLQQGFPIEMWYRSNRWRSKLALPVIEMICGLKTEIQRHKIKRRRGLIDARHFWELFSSFFFQSKGLLVFLDWARAIFLFSISEPTCDKLVLNRNKWCHFPSQVSVSAIALPLSWFTHCLFSLPPAICLWQDPPTPPQYVFYVFLSLFSVHPVVVHMSNGVSISVC